MSSSSSSNTATNTYESRNLGFIKYRPVWTAEKLVDELENYIVRIKEDKQQQHERKYLQHAVQVIADWTKLTDSDKPHVFVFDLSDFSKDEMIATEIYNLSRSDPSTLAHVLHKIVERLFTMVSARWFYESAAEEIQVVLK